MLHGDFQPFFGEEKSLYLESMFFDVFWLCFGCFDVCFDFLFVFWFLYALGLFLRVSFLADLLGVSFASEPGAFR